MNNMNIMPSIDCQITPEEDFCLNILSSKSLSFPVLQLYSAYLFVIKIKKKNVQSPKRKSESEKKKKTFDTRPSERRREAHQARSPGVAHKMAADTQRTLEDQPEAPSSLQDPKACASQRSRSSKQIQFLFCNKNKNENEK